MTEDKIYVAISCSGQYEDYHETFIFASFDKNKVETYVNRFNKIANDNYDRISKYGNENCFMYDAIVYYEITLRIGEIKFIK